MEAKARSVSVMARAKMPGLQARRYKAKRRNLTQRGTGGGTEGAEKRGTELKDFFLVAKVSESADVGDYEGDAELIVGAHLAESKAAELESEAAAFAVVTDLHGLALQGAIGDVVADAAGDVGAGGGFVAVPHEHR